MQVDGMFSVVREASDINPYQLNNFTMIGDSSRLRFLRTTTGFYLEK